MEKEESSGEKLEGLPKQEVSKIHGDQCTSAVARPALPPCTAGLALSALLQGTGEPALPVTLLCAGSTCPQSRSPVTMARCDESGSWLGWTADRPQTTGSAANDSVTRGAEQSLGSLLAPYPLIHHRR